MKYELKNDCGEANPSGGWVKVSHQQGWALEVTTGLIYKQMASPSCGAEASDLFLPGVTMREFLISHCGSEEDAAACFSGFDPTPKEVT